MAAVDTIKDDPDNFLPPLEHHNFTSHWNEEYGNDLCALAMYCVLFPNDTTALELAHTFMERMARQPSWEYRKMSIDEMPISHSLVGLATAYDFLYPTLSVDQRTRFFNRIRKCTARHTQRMKQTSWGRIHLQNHVWNNNVALLVGALVTGVHDTKAKQWADAAIKHLNISMKLFDLVVDGSAEEGVSYSTYTTRSLTTFVFLLDRHYRVKLYGSYWLQQHFWFLYRTLIGYKETVGIADSNPTWFYGPEAMLVFLDKFVLRNGYGNWLAARIREHRSRAPPFTHILAPSKTQRWSTYHLEFIWYDETLAETDPDPDHKPALARFSDWGVVTYGGGLPPKQTFFSFKSGYVHGRAINAAVKDRVAYPEHINGWMSFNPGHEHPDQNSFTFWPRGQPFITEAYYGPKFSFLNNVLMFAPSRFSPCSFPYEGQAGECHKWLDYLLPSVTKAHADVIAAYKVGGFVFTSGEAAGAYRAELMLKRFYRSLVLLTPDVLLVMDHVQLTSGSKLKRATAFFNMRQGNLTLDRGSKATLRHSGQEFHAAWAAAGGAKMTSSTAGYEFLCEYKTRMTQLLKVSVNLGKMYTRVAYIFYHRDSPRPSVPKFTENLNLGFKVAVKIGQVSYKVSVATSHDQPLKRLEWLGHTGFASLSTSTEKYVRFGSGQRKTSVRVMPSVFLSSMPWSGAELLAAALNKSADFAVAAYDTLQNLNSVSDSISVRQVTDPCVWQPSDIDNALEKNFLPKWLYQLFQRNYYRLSTLQVKFPPGFYRKLDARLVVFAGDGQMNTKLSLFPPLSSTKLLQVLRDPRAWVASALTRVDVSEYWGNIVAGLQFSACDVEHFSPPYKKLRKLLQQFQSEAANAEINMVEMLALEWVGHAFPVLRPESPLSSERLYVVWMEDLLLEPEKTLEQVFEFLGLPLPMASQHHLLQLVRSRGIPLSSGEVIDHRQREWWKTVLSSEDIRTVERTVAEFVELENVRDIL